MGLDKDLFKKHLDSASYEICANKGMWGVESNLDEWPIVIFWIKCSGFEGLKLKYYFKFNLESYPAIAPNATLWDLDRKTVLNTAEWPTAGELTVIFKPGWSLEALYLPCDRKGLAAHPEWVNQFKEESWKASSTIIDYLKIVYSYLNV